MSLQVARTANLSSVDARVRYLVADVLDDASSLGAKLAETGSHRVVLVIPRENRAMESPVALRVLARAASRESTVFAIVSERKRLRRLAAGEGVMTFPSLSAVPRNTAPETDTLPTPFRAALAELTGALSQGSSWAVALGLVLGLLAIVAVFLPRATVYVQPVTDQLSGTSRITASVDATAPDPVKGALPSRVVYLVVNSTGTIPVSSADHPLDGRAVGFVSLENRVNQKLTVPKGTDLSTFSGVHFATTRSVVLDGHPGATAEVPIVATGAGEYGNVLRGQIVVVGGPLRWLITAVNEDQTAGGGPPGQPIVTAWETHRLLDQVMGQARQSAQQRLAGVVSKDETAVPETIQVTPIEETFNHAIGDEAPTLSVTVQSRVEAMIVNQKDLDNLAMQVWHPNVRAGFVPAPNSIHVGTPSVVKVDSSSITFDVPVRAVASAEVNTDRVASYVRLRSPRDAERDLARLFDLASPPRVTITPSWLPRAYRVQVVVETNAAPTTSSASQR